MTAAPIADGPFKVRHRSHRRGVADWVLLIGIAVRLRLTDLVVQ